MTAIYSLQDNALREEPDLDPPPDKPIEKNYYGNVIRFHVDLYNWEKVMEGYHANAQLVASACRTIPCHESARSLWKDGQKLEFDKDYKLYKNCAVPGGCTTDMFCTTCEVYAMPITAKSEDLPQPMLEMIQREPVTFFLVNALKYLNDNQRLTLASALLERSTPPASAVDEAATLYPYVDIANSKELTDLQRSAHIRCAGMYTDTIDKLKAELAEAKDWQKHIPVMTNVPDRKDISREWQYLWSEIEAWYGDVKKKETGQQFLQRMQSTFDLAKFGGLETLKAENSKMRQALEPFIVAARHARNFPHPQIPVERLRAEATLAESNAEHLLGAKEYHTICESAFKDQ